MSTICTALIDSELQLEINSITNSSSFDDVVGLAISVDLNNSSNRISTVSSTLDLPDLMLNLVSSGTIVYVDSIQTHFITDGRSWFGLDGRKFRQDIYSYELWIWGGNGGGQLGIGNQSQRCSPVSCLSGGNLNWCKVEAGGSASAAIKTDGTLWTWGLNLQGKLGNGNTTHRSSPGTTAGGGTNWCTVSMGNINSAAIKTDGTLWTWGSNSLGQLGDGSGAERSSPGTTAGGGTNWKNISIGSLDSIAFAAIKTDGTLWTWGGNESGQLANETTTSRSSPGTTAGGGTNWCLVSAGGAFMSGIKTDGTLWTWGYNSLGKLGDGTTTSRSSPGTTAGGGTNWCMASSGPGHAVAIKTDGTLWTWGCNSCGRLGDGTNLPRSSPGTTVGGGTNWCWGIAADCHTAAIKTDGTLWTWGINEFSAGQLGNGSVGSYVCSPGTTAGGGTNWWRVAGGRYHTIALKRF